MNKKCIFNSKKLCNDCGDCDTCDLNPKKKCNNCGKCLEMEGYDTKAIKIEEIYEKDQEAEDIECDNVETKGAELSPEDPIWEFIDDIKEAKDLIENDNNDNKTHEVFPGLFTMNKNDLNKKNENEE